MIGEELIGELLIGSCAEYEAEVVDTSIYFSLGGYDLNGHVVLPIMPSGLTRNTSNIGIPTRARCRLSEEGMEPLSYEFQLIFDDKDEADAFRRLVNGLSENVAWCGGRSTWYQIAKYVSVSPAEIVDDLIHYLCNVVLQFENPMLIKLAATTFSKNLAPLPIQSPVFENDGTADAPLSFVFDARYAGGQHLKELALTLYDGLAEVSAVLLSNQLLSTERLEFSEGDTILCTYMENFIDRSKLTLDKCASSGLTEQDGYVQLAAEGYLTYKFYGPNPTLDNVLLQADFTITAGSPLVQVSTDNVTWKTAIAAVDMQDGYHSYYLDQSDKIGDFYVRFYCPVGATLDINFLRFVATRTITPDVEFVIPAGESYSVEISDAATSGHEVDAAITFQPRSWP
jgi:hypothetical protein